MNNTLNVSRQEHAQQGDDTLKPTYLVTLKLIERLQRLLLDVLKDELDRIGCTEVNSVQALLLFNIGDMELTAGEIRSRGFYMGSNVSYNLKKLQELGCIEHQRSESDRRAVRIRLTDRGKEISAVVNQLVERQLSLIEKVGGISLSDLEGMNKSLHRLERFWTDQIRYRL
ncbi:MAG: MarR family winged helix-turn-helix transcriptional regulator [Dichotomicrobium sp.]